MPLPLLRRYLPAAMRALADGAAEAVAALAAPLERHPAGGQAINRPVLLDAVREIQHQAITLVRMQPQATPDHLAIQAHREGRAQQHHAINPFGVKALGIDVHVTDRVIPALNKSLGNPLPLPDRCLARHRRRIDAILAQLQTHCMTMLHVHAKEDSSLALLGNDMRHSRLDRFLHHRRGSLGQ